MKDELVVVTHTGSKLARYDELTLEELCTLPLVLRENGSGTLAGSLKVIEVDNFSAQRMFAFVQLQGQSGGLEENFIRYMQPYK